VSWFLPFVPRGRRFFKVYSGPGYPLDPRRQVVQLDGDISSAPPAPSVENFQRWILDHLLHSLALPASALTPIASRPAQVYTDIRRLLRSQEVSFRVGADRVDAVNLDQAWARCIVELWNMEDDSWVLLRPSNTRIAEVYGRRPGFIKPRQPVLPAVEASIDWPDWK